MHGRRVVPFISKTKRRGAKKTVTFADINESSEVITGLKAWCIQAKECNRQYLHLEVDARDYSFEDGFLDAMCITESEAQRRRDVKTYIEFDLEEGLVAGADGVGVGGRPGRAGRGGRPRGSGDPEPAVLMMHARAM